MPKSPNKGNEGLTNKVHRLMSSTSILRLEQVTGAINKVALALNPSQKEFYDRLYRHNQGKIRICMEMYIEERTFYKYKDRVIESLAKELGYL